MGGGGLFSVAISTTIKLIDKKKKILECSHFCLVSSWRNVTNNIQWLQLSFYWGSAVTAEWVVLQYFSLARQFKKHHYSVPRNCPTNSSTNMVTALTRSQHLSTLRHLYRNLWCSQSHHWFLHQSKKCQVYNVHAKKFMDTNRTILCC